MASTTNVVVGPCRLSFFHGWEPKAPKGSTKLQYSTQILISKKDKKNLAIIEEAIATAKREGKLKLEGVSPKKLRSPLYDGEEEFPGDPNYVGMMYLNANNSVQPQIVKRVNGKIQDVIEETEVYSGCFAFVNVNFFAYNTVNTGIGCSLNNVCKHKDGERMDGRISAIKAFESVDFGDDEDDSEAAEEKPAIKKATVKKSFLDEDEEDLFA